MKIKIIKKSYDEIMAAAPEKHLRPKKPNMFFRTLMKALSVPALSSASFTHTEIGMEKLGKKEPCLYLMNHSAFIDLPIVAGLLYPRPFNIVATTDSFVGKGWLMRQIGCIPTKKFVLDIGLVRDMQHAVKKLGSSVVMFPEAGYSLDGTATTLPDSLGKFVKLLGVPVVMISTRGAFSREPLYNGLQKRKVPVSAEMKYLLSSEETKEKTPEEINEILAKEFSYDHFTWQKEQNIRIDEPFRADFLERVLYKCPHCCEEGSMVGKGIDITCQKCGKSYTLDEYGRLASEDAKFNHIPSWFAWQRECVRKEIEENTYNFREPVDIFMANDTKHIYSVGSGTLLHTPEGFKLTADDGSFEYSQNPQASHSICADFYWYELGDVIAIGNQKALYYCFPKRENVPVAKVRLAAEEMYKLYMDSRKKR